MRICGDRRRAFASIINHEFAPAPVRRPDSRMSAATSEPVIAFDDVHLGFDEGDILRGLSFRVAPRETKVLIGETGSGKTLALKLAAGLLQPDQGSVTVLGHDVGSMTESELLRFSPADRVCLSGGRAIRFADRGGQRRLPPQRGWRGPGRDRPARSRGAAIRRMEHAIDKLPDELSGGMRRRVAIARALVSKPPIVLYDSPTAGLDPITSQTIITLIMRLRDLQGVTSLLVTHRLQDAFGLANYRFDAEQNRVVPAPAKAGASRGESPNGRPATNFLVLRDGVAYFEGGPQACWNRRTLI